jgi:hypothetical protein
MKAAGSGRLSAVRSAVGKAALTSIHRLPLLLRRRILFAFYQRRLGHFKEPRTFSEKMNWRILYDRREELAWTCDKLAMKERAAKFGIRVPETFWQGEELADLAEVELPDEWVLKPNHRSGLVYFGKGRPDIEQLRKLTAGWLDESQWAKMGEWAYSRAKRALLVEERLSALGTATDYKVRVFHGTPIACAVIAGRFSNQTTLTFYSPSWERLPATQAHPPGLPVPPPNQLGALLEAARQMSGTLDFLRVDMYVIDDEVYMGEVTPYPAGGLEAIKPFATDLAWGRLWTLPTLGEDSADPGKRRAGTDRRFAATLPRRPHPGLPARLSHTTTFRLRREGRP